MSDWVAAAVLARGDALARKFVRLRDAADRAMLGPLAPCWRCAEMGLETVPGRQRLEC
jgi:hypothetical protein